MVLRLSYVLVLTLCVLVVIGNNSTAGEVSFTTKPTVAKEGDKTKVSFTVSASTDVEVAVLAADGKAVRHLAAGVLGAATPPPEPLKAGLAQEILWDGLNDFDKAATGGPFKIRVRAGLGVKFARLIGADPFNMGTVDSIAADEDGNVFIACGGSGSNQGEMVVRMFDSQGRYVREVVPFPANLPPDGPKNLARWDAERKTFFPRNIRNLNPDFYGTPGNYFSSASLALVSASKKNGLIFTDGKKLCTIDIYGAATGAKFETRDLGGVPNSGGGPVFISISPDGKYVYLSGPFSCTNTYGYKLDPNAPPGRVYRASLTGADKLKEFVTLPVDHKDGNGGAWLKACVNTANFTRPKGPVHQTVVDTKGNVYIADREHGCVVIYDESAKELGKIAIKNPHQIAVHPTTGAIYVTQFDCLAYGSYQCTLNKFDNYKEGVQAVAKLDFPPGPGLNASQSMTLAVGNDKTLVWMAGVKGGLVPLEDKGTSFVPVAVKFAPNGNIPGEWNRLAVDYDRDEVYISDGYNGMWRFDGMTGVGDVLKKDGKNFLVNDIAIGFDGMLYACVSGAQDGSAAPYSGPLWRLDRDLNPAPYKETGTHVLSKFIYSRMGVGFAERGMGVGPDGKMYVSFMYKWVAYAIGAFGSDGKPLKGKYLQGIFPSEKEKKMYPEGWDSAIIGPVPQMCANIRADFKGNIYVGLMTRPKGFVPPKGFEKDQGYRVSVGSVVKFGPEGGSMAGPDGATSVAEMQGALLLYPGLAPFSSAAEAFGGNTCCVCRVPRFDLDRYGRIALPNAMTNSVLIYDNAGNLILEFGKYGNFDSQYINPNSEEGKANKPTVAVPEIPLAWPTGVGFSEAHIYVNDTYNRRAMRLDNTYVLSETCDVK